MIAENATTNKCQIQLAASRCFEIFDSEMKSGLVSCIKNQFRKQIPKVCLNIGIRDWNGGTKYLS